MAQAQPRAEDALPADGIPAFGSGHGEENPGDNGGGAFHSIQVAEQPPLSNGSPSNIDTETGPVIDWPDMNKTFLPLAFNQFLAISAIRFGAGDSVAENAKILLSLSQLCSGVAAFLLSGGYIFERRKATLAGVMTAVGVVAGACTLVLAIGSLIANLK